MTYLISNNHERISFNAILNSRVMEELVKPHLDVVERTAVVYGIGQDADIGATVERSPEGLETFLAGCIPYLENI